MKILVCGSRDWNKPITVQNRIKELKDEHGPIEIVHGRATRGADAHARMAAQNLHLVEHSYPADWQNYGRIAGFIRNVRMLEDQKPDLVLAFWDGVSRGTELMITEALKRGVKVEINCAQMPVSKAKEWHPHWR